MVKTILSSSLSFEGILFTIIVFAIGIYKNTEQLPAASPATLKNYRWAITFLFVVLVLNTVIGLMSLSYMIMNWGILYGYIIIAFVIIFVLLLIAAIVMCNLMVWK